MKLNQLRNIDVGYPITVGKAESFLAKVLSHALQPAARAGHLTRVYQSDTPWFGMALVNMHAVLHHIEGDVRHVQEVVGEILLDDIALVTQTDDEIGNPVMLIDLHYVPDYWLTAHFNHGLGLEVRFLADSGSKPSSKNNGLHFLILVLTAYIANILAL